MSLSLFSLQGRRALVTGSGQGIGLALAQGLGLAGGAVVLNGRDRSKLDGAAEGLRAQGIEVAVAAFDVTDHDAVVEGVGRIERDVGSIDILVNNAGIQRRAPLEDFAVETWHEVMRANLDSVFFVSQAVARAMIPRGRGKIINIGSLMSEAARYSVAPYTAAKGAVKNLTKGMCTDWARHGLQINAIGPGYFATPLQSSPDRQRRVRYVAEEAHSGRALGTGRGVAGSLHIPGIFRVRFRQWADHLCGRRRPGDALT